MNNNKITNNIRFRGKRIDNDEWIYGGYYYNEQAKRAFIITTDPNHGGLFTEVNKETVGQFTGIQDKNNKDVYYGDVIEIEKSYLIKDMTQEWQEDIERLIKTEKFYLVFKFNHFNSRVSGFSKLPIDSKDWLGGMGGHAYYFCLKGEIIGNAHDNPKFFN